MVEVSRGGGEERGGEVVEFEGEYMFVGDDSDNILASLNFRYSVRQEKKVGGLGR